MKIRKHNSLLLALLLAPLAALAQTPSTASETVRDRLWIFTVVEGGNNKKSPASPNGNVKHYIDDFAPGGSRMTPAEGAFWLGVPNLLFIRSNNLPAVPADQVNRRKTSYQQYATSFQPLDRVVWSTVGAGGEGGMGGERTRHVSEAEGDAGLQQPTTAGTQHTRLVSIERGQQHQAVEGVIIEIAGAHRAHRVVVVVA